MQTETYPVEHLMLAAWLVAHNMKIAGTTLSEKKSTRGETLYTFHFEKAPALEILTHGFWNNSMVAIQDYISALNTVRAMIRTEKRR